MSDSNLNSMLKKHYEKLPAPDTANTLQGVQHKMHNRPSAIKTALTAAGNAFVLLLAVGIMVAAGLFAWHNDGTLQPLGWEGEGGYGGYGQPYAQEYPVYVEPDCICHRFENIEFRLGPLAYFKNLPPAVKPGNGVYMYGYIFFDDTLAVAELHVDITWTDDNSIASDISFELKNWFFCCNVIGVYDVQIEYELCYDYVILNVAVTVITADGTHERREQMVGFGRPPLAETTDYTDDFPVDTKGRYYPEVWVIPEDFAISETSTRYDFPSWGFSIAIPECFDEYYIRKIRFAHYHYPHEFWVHSISMVTHNGSLFNFYRTPLDDVSPRHNVSSPLTRVINLAETDEYRYRVSIMPYGRIMTGVYPNPSGRTRSASEFEALFTKYYNYVLNSFKLIEVDNTVNEFCFCLMPSDGIFQVCEN